MLLNKNNSIDKRSWRTGGSSCHWRCASGLWLLVGAVSVSAPHAAMAQDLVSATSTLDASGAVMYRTSFVYTAPPAIPAVAGRPYCAEEVRELVLADGTRQQQPQESRAICRDTRGRTRVERALAMGPGIAQPPRIIEIADIVSGYHYLLDPLHQVAHRSRTRAQGERPPRALVELSPAGTTARAGSEAGPEGPTQAAEEQTETPEPVVANRPTEGDAARAGLEALGSRTVSGVPATGTRRTTVFSASGESTTSETWESPELQIVVLTVLAGPGQQRHITRLANIRRGESDADLFSVPAGYTIQDEPRAFELRFP